MSTILVLFTATVIAAIVILLAVLRLGVSQQEHAGSLDRRPRGLSAAISRRVFGLYVGRPERAADRPAGLAKCGGIPSSRAGSLNDHASPHESQDGMR
jgi:hypothetical protein